MVFDVKNFFIPPPQNLKNNQKSGRFFFPKRYFSRTKNFWSWKIGFWKKKASNFFFGEGGDEKNSHVCVYKGVTSAGMQVMGTFGLPLIIGGAVAGFLVYNGLKLLLQHHMILLWSKDQTDVLFIEFHADGLTCMHIDEDDDCYVEPGVQNRSAKLLKGILPKKMEFTQVSHTSQIKVWVENNSLISSEEPKHFGFWIFYCWIHWKKMKKKEPPQRWASSLTHLSSFISRLSPTHCPTILSPVHRPAAFPNGCREVYFETLKNGTN